LLSTHISERYNNTIYPTMVITGPENKMKIQWLVRPDKRFCDLCRLYGTELKKIASDNPRKIENILMDDVRYYFFTEHFREGLVNYCVFVFLYSIPRKNEEVVTSVDFVQKLYSSCTIPSLAPISYHSLKLSEYVRNSGKISTNISELMSVALDERADNEKEYFYPIEQVGNRIIKTCFDKEGSPCRFKTVRSDSNMYIQVALMKFSFFLTNVMLMIAKFSLRTVEVSFKNEIETLRILFRCPFHNSFFGFENDRNSDVNFGEICELNCSHPAFVDYELLKRIANDFGAAFTLRFDGKNYGLVEIVFSKADVLFKNVLHAACIPEGETDIPIYAVDVDNLL